MKIVNGIPIEQKEAILNSLRGFYSNSFFHIYIDGEFNPKIEEIVTIKDQGTVQHEYTHYIQNIGTLWGLYSSMVMYEQILELKEYIKRHDKLSRPIDMLFSDGLKRKLNFIEFGNGTSYYDKCIVDTNKPIFIRNKIEKVNDKEQKAIYIDFMLHDGTVRNVLLGAFVIKESMAAMYQSLLDSDASHYDIPYNVVQLLANSKYPNTAKDVRKLICCCHASLFSMNPGFQLIQLLDEAEHEPRINGFRLFESFVKNNTVRTGIGNHYKIVEYFNKMVDGFLAMLDINISAPIDYIRSALERVKLDGKYYPFLSVLYETSYSSKDLSEIISYYGIPYIQTPLGLYYPKGKIPEYKDGSLDVLELIVQEAICKMLLDSKHRYCCPLFYMCSNSKFQKDECFGTPWTGNLCSFKIISDSWNLNKKEIN